MLEIKEKDNISMNKEQLLRLYIIKRSSDLKRELSNEESTKIEKRIDYLLNSFITRNFVAYEANEIVAWLGIFEVLPCTIIFHEEHPIIWSNDNKTSIAIELLKTCFKYAIEKKTNNVRVFVDVTKENEKRFLELEEYYLKAGMQKTHIVHCMENKLSTITKGTTLNNDYHLELAKDQTLDALTECYNRIFVKALDNFTNSLDNEERKHWNTITNRGKINEASIVIKKGKEIVALILAVDYGEYMELGPIGVVPEHRGRKLGKILMEECLTKLIDQGKVETYLEVDQTNIPAINLYKSYGFFEVSKKHGFLWRKQ